MSSDSVSVCPGCGTKFSALKWKHQCRRCNAIRCHDCSENKMPIPKLKITKPSRVCDPCFIALSLAQKNTADLDKFPVKILKQFAIDYNIPAALNNALEKKDIITGLLKYYNSDQDRTHEKVLNDKKNNVNNKPPKQPKQPKSSEYPGNVRKNTYSSNNNNVNSNQGQNRQSNVNSSFNPWNFFSGSNSQPNNNQQNSSNNNSSSGGFFDNIGEMFNSFFDSSQPQAHPYQPPHGHQYTNANTNVHASSGPYNTNQSYSQPYSTANVNANANVQNQHAYSANVNNNNSGSSAYRPPQPTQPRERQQSASSSTGQSAPQPQAPAGEVIIPENFELSEMSVSQLKEILKRHRVDFKDCVEKSDLIQKIRDKIMNKTSDADKKSSGSNNNSNNNRSSVYDPQPVSEEKDICVICQDRHIKCVFLECGHLACCMECSVKVQHCPLCRKYITRVVEIYHANK